MVRNVCYYKINFIIYDIIKKGDYSEKNIVFNHSFN